MPSGTALIDHIAAFLSTSHQLTPLSFGVLVLVFMASGFVLLPRIVLCVLAGAAYGPVAIPIAIPSATLGALLAFLTARYLVGEFVQRRIARRKVLSKISNAVDQEGWRIVALMRLGGPVPGAITNYLFGLTNIGWWAYAWATFVFCIPQIILFVCLGAARTIGGGGRPGFHGDARRSIALGVVTCAAIIFLVAKRARTIFAELRD